MRIRNAALLAALVIAVTGPVRADDIVYFTNGTAMPVRSHKIEKDMIRVDLGSNATMAFPVSMVEKVESSGRNVFPNSGGAPANQAIAGTPSTLQNGQASVPSQYRRQINRDDPEQQLAAAQARAQNPGGARGNPAGTDTAAKRNLRVIAGGTPVINEDGTFQRGNVSVLTAPNAPFGARGNDDSKPVITSLGPPDAKVEPVADEDSGAGDGDGDGDGDGGGTDPDADDPPDQN